MTRSVYETITAVDLKHTIHRTVIILNVKGDKICSYTVIF